MKKNDKLFCLLCVLFFFQITVPEEQNSECQVTGSVAVLAQYVPHKYQEVVVQHIDKYLTLCVSLERVVGKLEFNLIKKHLLLTHPCIIDSYHAMVMTKTVAPLVSVWAAYKRGVITIDKQKFLYELCHLIGMVFEQFLIKIAADLTGQSVQSLTELLDKLQIDVPIDDLIDILEHCYQELSLIADQLNTQQKITWNKKTIMAVLTGVVLIYKLCQYYLAHAPQKTTV